jgi:hypothetical protein
MAKWLLFVLVLTVYTVVLTRSREPQYPIDPIHLN